MSNTLSKRTLKQPTYAKLYQSVTLDVPVLKRNKLILYPCLKNSIGHTTCVRRLLLGLFTLISILPGLKKRQKEVYMYICK